MQVPGEVLGYQLHPKNAACKRKYLTSVARLQERGITGPELELALEDVRHVYANSVPIYYGLNSLVRKDMRSKLRREEREDARE